MNLCIHLHSPISVDTTQLMHEFKHVGFNSGYLEVRQPTVLLVQASRQIGIHVC